MAHQTAVGTWGLLAVAVMVTGCASSKPQPTHPTAASVPAPAEVLPFIHDDYPKALAEAKQRNKPLFVDAWAPWCHSCQSLRSFVLTDPVLRPLASDFVWLSVDTEKEENGEWIRQHPHSALPTLWVIDPATNRALLKWAGTATAEELRVLLQIAVAGPSDQTMEAMSAFVRGNHALAEGDLEGAIQEHRAAIAAAAKDHPHRARMVEALVSDLVARKDEAACADTAAAEAGVLPPGTSRASAIVAGLDCARAAKKIAEEDRLAELALFDVSHVSHVSHVSPTSASPLLPDDRSGLYEQLIETRKSRGDDAGATALARQWAAFLDGEVARAKTKDARASLDPWVLAASLAMGDPARAIPALEQSERDFPADYNPPARLGRAYLELKRFDEADRAADRAIARVYGPRAMRVYGLKADIAKARGDRAGETSALEAALARSEHAVLTQGQTHVREGLAKRLAKLR